MHACVDIQPQSSSWSRVESDVLTIKADSRNRSIMTDLSPMARSSTGNSGPMQTLADTTTLDTAPEPDGITSQKRPVEAMGSQSDTAEAKRARIESPVVIKPAYQQSPTFWYPDGNIVIVVKTVGFRLFLSRLKLHCKLFAREILEPQSIPSDRDQAEEGGESEIQSHECPRCIAWLIYARLGCIAASDGSDKPPSSDREYTLSDIESADFATFLHALETPLQYALGSERANQFAKDRLRSLWPLTLPPMISKITFKDAINVINIARNYNIPEVLRRAFYEVLRSSGFWDQLHARRPVKSLSKSDIISLQHARIVLQEKATALFFIPPGENGKCASSGRAKTRCTGHDRAPAWTSSFVTHSRLEACSTDPLGFADSICQGEEFQDLVDSWCPACLEERKLAWAAAKLEWWASLDSLFKI
ncbi:hypothetical protein PYCCODRAFT_1212482 [Trametes coccinea BRFM310]|uniref:BTB domain-containing protein n=1 Tax=Trametes coccinea (strain BRFM310) TaxID=1353009 RepID=A0A1Y2I6Y3_TRAC3|nr:hypothetical protein PYCCODRAFT_1212482 [Trametes coccinea BRFM310]